MKALKTAFAGLAATMAFTSVSALAQTAVQDAQFNSSGLAVESIASGEALEAIALLRQELRAHPNDPALLINLGIALAHSGQEADARASFEAALSSGEIMDLERAVEIVGAWMQDLIERDPLTFHSLVSRTRSGLGNQQAQSEAKAKFDAALKEEAGDDAKIDI